MMVSIIIAIKLKLKKKKEHINFKKRAKNSCTHLRGATIIFNQLTSWFTDT